MKYSVHDIAHFTEGTLQGNMDLYCEHILLDTRQVTQSSSTMFVAIKGEQHDGHRFVEDACQKGVRIFLLNKDASVQQLTADGQCSVIFVDDTLAALQQLAAIHRHKYYCPVVGITGSNGKTIVKEWGAHIIDAYYSTVRSPRSYNSQVGVPLSVMLMEEHHQLALFEAGISQKGEMQRLEEIVKPNVGVLTNIGKAHQENFETLNEKLREKLLLFGNVDLLIYCADQSEVAEELSHQFSSERLVGWTTQNAYADVYYETTTKGNVTFCKGHFYQQAFSFSLPYTSAAFVEDALHAITLAAVLDIPLTHIETVAQELPQIAMRLEMVQGTNNCTLINDSYNSDLNSLAIALNMIVQQQQHNNRVLVLSDILQTGVADEELYKQVAKWIEEYRIDRFVGVGPRILAHQLLFPETSEFYLDTESFLKQLTPGSFRNETILLKGSRVFHFEDVARQLQERIHETALEVNLNHLVHNLNYYRGKLADNVKLMVMVKAFSYGSGSFEIANVLQYHRVDYLGVAFVDEGIALRKGGITVPIVVMNPEPSAFQSMIDYELEPELYNLFTLKLFVKIVRQNGLEYYPVHIKFDTGMHRLGFQEEELAGLCQHLGEQNALRVESVFSHLAGSDESRHDIFTRKQVNAFLRMVETLEEAIGYAPIKHIANTAGIERFPHAHLDMVRLGIGLYGVSAETQDALKPVSRLRSFVLQVKTIAKGETIGYGRVGKAKDEMQIAIIPIGYADGFRRIFSNGVGEVLVNGKRCPVVGNVCMDMTMINVSGVEVQEGDEVELFGEYLSVNEWADKLQTIPYEVFTSIPPRVRRVYLQE